MSRSPFSSDRRSTSGSRVLRGGRGTGPEPGGEHGRLAQHGLLQGAHLGPRVEPELVGEQLAVAAQHVQGIDLPAGADQRQRLQRPGALAQRVPGCGLLGRGQHGGVLTQGEQAERGVLLGRGAQVQCATLSASSG